MFGSSLALIAIAALSLCVLALGGVILVLSRRLARASEAKLGSESRYHTVIEQAGDGIFLVDARTGYLIEANPALRRRLGYGPEEIVTLKVEEVLIEQDLTMETHASLMEAYSRSSARTLKERCKDGRLLDVEVAVSTLEVEGRRALCYISHDVTERRAAERELLRNQQRLHHIAHHDCLTGLPNRLRLMTHLEALVSPPTPNPDFALMLLDLDDFKRINDSLGHHIGDQLLVAVATRLKSSAGPTDMVARLGGDEFVIVRRGLHEGRALLASARQIAALVGQPLSIGEHTLAASVSIGIAVSAAEDSSLETLMRNADLAMYAAKSKAQGSVRLFESDMTHFLHRNMARRA